MKYNVYFGTWGKSSEAKGLTDVEVVAKLQELMLSNVDWISIISHHSNSMVYIDLAELKSGEAIGCIASKNYTKIFSDIRNPFNVDGIDTFGEYLSINPRKEMPNRSRGKNWKHRTKNRHPYMKDGRTWMVNGCGEWIYANRREAKRYGKHNTPFMQDEFDKELVADDFYDKIPYTEMPSLA